MGFQLEETELSKKEWVEKNTAYNYWWREAKVLPAEKVIRVFIHT